MAASSETPAILVKPEDRDKYKTVHEVAGVLGRSVKTVKEWIRLGLVDGPSHYEEKKNGFVWLYDESDIGRYCIFIADRHPGRKKQSAAR